MDQTPAERARQGVPEMRARDLRARRTMKLLHAALLDLIREHSFDEITVDDIVAKAEVGRSTFYRHYATKEALIDEIATAEIERLVDRCYAIFDRSDSWPSALALATYVDEHRKLWTSLFTGGAAGLMRDTFRKLALERARLMVDETDLEIPFELGAAWGVSGTFEVLSWWLRQPEGLALDKVADYLDRLSARPVLDKYHRSESKRAAER